jgi:hypothetical protein
MFLRKAGTCLSEYMVSQLRETQSFYHRCKTSILVTLTFIQLNWIQICYRVIILFHTRKRKQFLVYFTLWCYNIIMSVCGVCGCICLS